MTIKPNDETNYHNNPDILKFLYLCLQSAHVQEVIIKLVGPWMLAVDLETKKSFSHHLFGFDVSDVRQEKRAFMVIFSLF